jgi:uncharacterized membrane protein
MLDKIIFYKQKNILNSVRNNAHYEWENQAEIHSSTHSSYVTFPVIFFYLWSMLQTE